MHLIKVLAALLNYEDSVRQDWLSASCLMAVLTSHCSGPQSWSTPDSSHQQILLDLTLKISPESHCFVGHSLLSSAHGTFISAVVMLCLFSPDVPVFPSYTRWVLGVECTTYFTQSVHTLHRGSPVNTLGTHGKGEPWWQVNCHSNGELTLIIEVDQVNVITRVPIYERGGRSQWRRWEKENTARSDGFPDLDFRVEPPGGRQAMRQDVYLKSLCLWYFVTAGTGNSCDFGQLWRSMPDPRASPGVAEASVATILQAGFSLCPHLPSSCLYRCISKHMPPKPSACKFPSQNSLPGNPNVGSLSLELLE